MLLKQSTEQFISAKQMKRARGVKLGRPPKPLPNNFHEVYQKWKVEKVSTKEAARLVNMPPSTFRYRANSYKKTTL